MDPIPLGTELYLEFDLNVQSIIQLGEITRTIRDCSSLVNEDILNISDEIIDRFLNDKVPQHRNILLSIKYIYNTLQGIPGSHDRRDTIYRYYSLLINSSPSVSPVETPRKYTLDALKNTQPIIQIPFMKKIKKLKDD